MFFGDVACKVHKRSVHKSRDDKDAVAKYKNFANGIPWENARKRKQVEHKHIYELAYKSRPIVADPQVTLLILESFLGPLPPGVIRPNVEHFANCVCKQAREHHARCIREHRTDRFRHRIACSRDVQEPALRNENKRHIRENADFHAAARLFFAIDFAHHVRCEEGGCENDIAERRVEPKGVHENQDFDICGNRCNDGPSKNALLTEKTEKSNQASKEHENGGYHKEFVLHDYFLLSIAAKRRVLAIASNSVPGLP